MVAPNTAKNYRLEVLAQHLGAELLGDGECLISGLATLQTATTGQISFLANPCYCKYLSQSQASAVVLQPDMAEEFSGNKLLLDNPYLGYAQLTTLFTIAPSLPVGIHMSAVIAATATVDPTARIGAHVVIEAGANIAADVQVGAGCYVGDDCVVGAATILYPGVHLYHGVSIGQDCIVHSGAVVGSDGFGIVPSMSSDSSMSDNSMSQMQGWIKIHHLGGVEIGDDVEIGANTTIDRGSLDNTVIETGVKLDNQVHIAHNVHIGKNTAIAGCVGIAGSTTIGANCTIAGAVGIIGHLDIVDNVRINAMTLVTKSIKTPGTYASGIPFSNTREWRKNAVRFRQLEDIVARLKRLEQR